MRQFDVYRNPARSTQKAMPYLVVLQSDVVSETAMVIVAALVPALKTSKPSRLYPTFDVAGRRHMLLTPDLASIPRTALTAPITSLREKRDKIIAALDILFVGI
jgi:toxin CcdB